MNRILVTGSTGQIGTELTPALRGRYGADNVVAAGHTTKPDAQWQSGGPYVTLDIRDKAALETVVRNYRVATIYHLAALLSFEAEANPKLAWDVNINGLLNVLEVARQYECAVFHPSSIGAFGPGTPKNNTPQETIQRPSTIYGVTKVTGELLCDYYHARYGVDSRGVRYPGIISHEMMPGGGTTDYAVEIFHAAIGGEKYPCFLAEGTYLDMMYMPDAIRAAITLMEADPAVLRYRNAYNISAMSFAPEELCTAIKKHVPGFVMDYAVDPVRQAIADSWPNKLDDSSARRDWGWSPEYHLESMVADMLSRLALRAGEK